MGLGIGVNAKIPVPSHVQVDRGADPLALMSGERLGKAAAPGNRTVAWQSL